MIRPYFFHQNETSPPKIMRTADVVKMKGHSLNGKKLILNPVNNDSSAMARSIMAVIK